MVYIRIYLYMVATALTVYGIETTLYPLLVATLLPLLQQHLPFTVLKHQLFYRPSSTNRKLQQHLPFTVLKLQFH